MGKNSAKKIAARNKSILWNHTRVLVGVISVHFLFRFILSSKPLTILRMFGSIVLVGLEYVTFYLFIYKHGLPKYDQSGEIEDCGGDLSASNGSLIEYAFDILYVLMAIQTLTLISEWFWILLLVIPIFAAYKIYFSIIKPYNMNKAVLEGMNEDPSQVKKKRPKMKRY